MNERNHVDFSRHWIKFVWENQFHKWLLWLSPKFVKTSSGLLLLSCWGHFINLRKWIFMRLDHKLCKWIWLFCIYLEISIEFNNFFFLVNLWLLILYWRRNKRLELFLFFLEATDALTKFVPRVTIIIRTLFVRCLRIA